MVIYKSIFLLFSFESNVLVDINLITFIFFDNRACGLRECIPSSLSFSCRKQSGLQLLPTVLIICNNLVLILCSKKVWVHSRSYTMHVVYNLLLMILSMSSRWWLWWSVKLGLGWCEFSWIQANSNSQYWWAGKWWHYLEQLLCVTNLLTKSQCHNDWQISNTHRYLKILFNSYAWLLLALNGYYIILLYG